MRFGTTLLVSLAFGVILGGTAPTVTAQTSVGFRDPEDMEALLSYRLPDWGYRTISFQLGLLGDGSKNSGTDAASAFASETLQLQWYRESEKQTWSLSGVQSGLWNWEQTNWEPDETIESALRGNVFLSAAVRNYVTGDLFVIGSTFGNALYQEGRVHEGSVHDTFVSRNFRGTLRLGAGLGRIRVVTPVLQAQRLSERLQALGRQPLPVDDVLQLAAVLAQQGGYRQVFDRPNRQLWRDVLEPLMARGETLTPFEVYYLGDVFNEVLGSRREGLLIDVSARVDRETGDYGNTYGRTYWGPDLGLQWSHNLSLDHQLSGSMNALYLWSDFEEGSETQRGLTSLSLAHQWVVADRFLWINSLSGSLRYSEWTDPTAQLSIAREQGARLFSGLSFFVEDQISIGPSMNLEWRRIEDDDDWSELLTWRMEFGITYDLENRLF